MPLVACPGASIAFLFGRPFWQHFPFGLPSLYKEKRIVIVEATTAVIRDGRCCGAATALGDLRRVRNAAGEMTGDMCCKYCSRLQEAPWLLAAAKSAKSSDVGLQSLQLPRITFAQLMATSARRKSARDASSLDTLNLSRRLAAAYGRVELHDQLLHAMADGSVPRLSALIAITLRSGRGPGHIARMLALAKAGAYKVKGFSMAERDIMLLTLRLGHRGLTYAVAQALGLPSITTALKRSWQVDRGIAISHTSLGGKERMRESIHRVIERVDASYKAAGIPGKPLFSIVNDATVVTAGAGVSLGSLTGLCQCTNVDVQPKDYEDLVKIAGMVKSGEIHLVKNVNVHGFVDLLGGHHGVEEVHVQGVCNCAGADWHASVTKMIQDVWREEGFEESHGPIVHCAHDGASAMRAAFEMRVGADARASMHPRVEAVRKLLEDLRPSSRKSSSATRLPVASPCT
jgi:hypothetical protein